MPNLQTGDRVEWTGVRTGAPRRGVYIDSRDGIANIRTDKGGYTTVDIKDLKVLS